MNNLPVFIITLDEHNIERAQNTLLEAKKLGFNNIQFINGVNGKQLYTGSDGLNKLKNIISIRAYFELANGRYVHEALSGLGSVGCYLSHIKAIEKCIELNQDIVIMEDDFVPTSNAVQLLPLIYNDAKLHNFGILKLSHLNNLPGVDYPKPTRVSEYLNASDSGLRWSNACYIVTPLAAKIILQNAYPIDMHFDHYLNFLAFRGDIIQFFSRPSLYNYGVIKSVTEYSTIGHSFLRNYIFTFMWDYQIPILIIIFILWIIYLKQS